MLINCESNDSNPVHASWCWCASNARRLVHCDEHQHHWKCNGFKSFRATSLTHVLTLFIRDRKKKSFVHDCEKLGVHWLQNTTINMKNIKNFTSSIKIESEGTHVAPVCSHFVCFAKWLHSCPRFHYRFRLMTSGTSPAQYGPHRLIIPNC